MNGLNPEDPLTLYYNVYLPYIFPRIVAWFFRD